MGCPDAVRAELLKLPGVLEVTYRLKQDRFEVRYESVLVSLETIFAAIANAGRMMGKEYLPAVAPAPEGS
jgi:copper chaperone CopZ